MNKIVLASLTAASLAVSSLVLAGPTTRTVMPCTSAPSHWYVGIGANYNSVLDEKHSIQTKYDYKLHENDLGFNVFVGNRLTPTFAAELGFSYFGDAEYKLEGSNIVDEIEDQFLVYFDGYYFVPLSRYAGGHSFEVFVKGGVNYFNVENDERTGSGSHVNIEDQQKVDGFALNYGAGLQYNYEQFGARLAYTRMVPAHDVDEIFGLTDAISLDVMWQFT